MKSGISAIVVVHNQSDLLQSCLKSIKNWVDQIIVIDLESTEDIEKIANLAGADYAPHKLVPIVEEVRQESLKYAEHEYVLFIDPDENIPGTLAKDLSAKIKTGKYDYFSIPRQNFVFGKWVKNSRWWPDFQTRIFRVGKVSWGKTLHAEAQASGNGYTYDDEERFSIHHDNYLSLDEWLSKNMRYAKADARARAETGDKLTLAQATKLSVSELISRFFAGEGYKDGMHGLILSILQSFYYFMVYAYYWEAMKYSDLESTATIKSFPRNWFSLGLSETLYWDKAKSTISSIKEKIVRKIIG
jgi:(heptosyl)LPS beta-1,4-glucosyltransferase